MKKKIIIKSIFVFQILAVLLTTSCTKQDINSNNKLESEFVLKDEAVLIAKRFSGDNAILNYPDKTLSKKTIKNKKPKEIESTSKIQDNNSNVTMYIINFAPEGFVIISASKKETPILAFSEHGSFNLREIENNHHVKHWVETRNENIKRLRNNGTSFTSEEIDEQWLVYSFPPEDEEIIISGGTVYEQEGPLLSTTWDQGCGYNDLLETCSSGGACGKVWAGCTVTATAQVMRHWEHPNNYNWTNMPINSGSYEVSRLMRDIGNAIPNIEYSCSGTGASLAEAKNALVNTFSYSSYASLIDFNQGTMRSQLNINHPVIMQGFNQAMSSGHAFVCDGYKRNRYVTIHNPDTHYEYETYIYSPLYLHINWGWSGAYNGWFYYDDLTPGSSDYNYNNKMIINVYP